MDSTIECMSTSETVQGGFIAHIPWQQVIAVGIRTTGDGPFEEDLFWQFLLPGRLVEVPGSSVTDLDELTAQMPGFDANKIIMGMTSCKRRVFRLWHHEESRDRLDAAMLKIRLGAVYERLGARTPVREVVDHVYAAWASKARRYHDIEHLTDCLRKLEREPASPRRDLVELALFYHDAVYEAGATDCEPRSAAWLLSDAAALGISASASRPAAALVLATAHGTARPISDEAALIIDIDLSILGSDSLRFMEYEYGVEEEYAAVPTIAFRDGRRRFLSRLLTEPIFRTASYRSRFEAAARANVTALLQGERYRARRWLGWLTA